MSNGPWFIPLLLVLFGGIWALSCFIISRFGWSRLARHYPDQPNQQGPSWIMPWARVGWASYRSTLKLTATQGGLRLSALAFIRPGHQPILIPWPTLSVERTHWVTVPAVRLHTTQCPHTAIVIPAKYANAIALTVGEAWPETPLCDTPPNPNSEKRAE